jgi:hypothetical protein
MAITHEIREGGCACGAVRFTVAGNPRRVGLCHCLTCRKAHASAFNPFAVFAPEQVEVAGELTDWQNSRGFVRRFCTKCGSQAVGGDGEEIEISLGSFDQPRLFEPQYELWVIRREHWLEPLDVPQFDEDRR